MRFLLYLLWSVASLVVVALVAVAVLLTVYHDPIEERLVTAIEKFTDRNLEINGDFGFRFVPGPRFIIRDIRMANAEWGSRPWMLEIESVSAGISLSGLMRGQLQLADIEGVRPRVLVEKDSVSGRHNWQFERRQPRPFPWLAENLKLENALLKDARVEIEVGRIPHLLELQAVTGQSDYFTGLANIKALGQLDAHPLELDIQLDSLKTMFLRAPSHIVFQGRHGETRLTGRGQIADLMRWQGHDIMLELGVPSLAGLQSWFTTRLIDTPPLQARARFVQPQRWASARLEEIDVTSSDLDGETRISGRVDRVRDIRGVELNGHMRYPLAEIMRWKQFASSTDIVIDAQMSLTGDRDSALALQIDTATLTGEGVAIRGGGRVSHLLAPDTEGIAFEGSIDSLARVGTIIDRSWFATGPISGRFELARVDRNLALQNIELEAFDQRASLRGSLNDIVSGRIGLFEVRAALSGEDVNLVNRLNQSRLPAFGMTELAGTIDMERSNFSARYFDLALESSGLRIAGEGAVTDLKTLDLEDVDISMTAGSIAAINRQFKLNLPELGSFTANGKLYGDLNNTYNINILESLIKSEYQLISGAGRLQQLGPDMTARIELNARIGSVANIPPLFKSELRVPDQVQGRGTAVLSAEGYRNWSLTEIDTRFEGDNQGMIRGSVVNFPLAPGFALEADFDRLSTAELPRHQVMDTLRPENIRAYLHINKQPEQDHFSVDDIDAQFSLATGGATVNVVGRIDNLNQLDGLALQLGLNTADIHAVPYFSSLPLKDNLNGVATVWLSGRVGQLGISILNARLSDSDIRGDLTLVADEGVKPTLVGRLTSENLDILGLLAQAPRTKLFSSETFAFDWLNSLNAGIELSAARLNGVISEVYDSEIIIKIEEGTLKLPNMTGKIGAGTMTAWFTLAATSKPYSIVTSLKAENVNPAHLNLFGDSGFIRDGLIDIDVGLGGSGMSIADYMGNAYGKVQLQLTDSKLKHRNLKLFGADLISGVLNILDTLDTLQNKAIYMPIECGVIHFPVIDGQAIASQGIAIKTEKTTVLGGGIIDLGSEELELIIKPKARQGLGLSAGTVANIVKVSGKIGDTRVAVDTSGLIQSSAAIGAAVVSGGWTLLLQGLADKNKANSDVCRQTLEKPNASFFKQANVEASFFEGVQTER